MLRAAAAALAPALMRRGVPSSAAASLSTTAPAAAAKATTGIVGLDVDPNARASLETALTEVLASLAAHVPAGAEYRRSLEAVCGERLAAVRSSASDADLESTLGHQMEAVTRQLQDELDLIPRMREWAPWEVEAGATRELRIERPVVAGEKK